VGTCYRRKIYFFYFIVILINVDVICESLFLIIFGLARSLLKIGVYVFLIQESQSIFIRRSHR
jgi:hypothetical protein